MTRYKGKDVVVELDNSGGTPVDLSQYIETMSAADIQHAMEDSYTFGDQWKEQLPANFRSAADITVGGKYDDTASTGPVVVIGGMDNSATRTFKATWGGTNTWSVEVYLKSWRIIGKRGAFSMFEAVLSPTGAVTVA